MVRRLLVFQLHDQHARVVDQAHDVNQVRGFDRLRRRRGRAGRRILQLDRDRLEPCNAAVLDGPGPGRLPHRFCRRHSPIQASRQGDDDAVGAFVLFCACARRHDNSADAELIRLPLGGKAPAVLRGPGRSEEQGEARSQPGKFHFRTTARNSSGSPPALPNAWSVFPGTTSTSARSTRCAPAYQPAPSYHPSVCK